MRWRVRTGKSRSSMDRCRAFHACHGPSGSTSASGARTRRTERTISAAVATWRCFPASSVSGSAAARMAAARSSPEKTSARMSSAKVGRTMPTSTPEGSITSSVPASTQASRTRSAMV